MNLFELTRALVDTESVTNNEGRVGDFLFDYVSTLARRYGGTAERMPAEHGRCNVFASWGTPTVTLSTHMDTVPPFFPSREDEQYIWGRGACDAKGILAAMIVAAEELLGSGVKDFGLLFVVGEERDSAGARVASQAPRGSRFLINGEPTENKLAIGSKGALRLELTARGRLAHSGYPELGDSAIESLLDALQQIRELPLPQDAALGKCTVNIGTISGGRAPNVVADEAHAEIMFRMVGDPDPIRRQVQRICGASVSAEEVLFTPLRHFSGLDGLLTTIVAFTTDIPVLEGVWGKPYLIGPGSIRVAHTAEERISKRELACAVQIYVRMVKTLLSPAGHAEQKS